MHSIVLVRLVIFSFYPLIKAQKDNGNQCDCFKTNGSSGSYFKYHRFFDYRNVPSALISQPAVVTQASEDKNDVVTSAFFSESSWTNDWNTQTWDNSDSMSDSGSDAHTLMRYSKNNVYIESNSDNGIPSGRTHLTLRTARTKQFQSASEIDTVAKNYQYLSIRYLARVVGSPGACAGLFTWYCPDLCRSASSPFVEEADIEILTSDPPQNIHLTNQPSESPTGKTIKEATRNATLPAGIKWNTWNEYRYDWTPGMSTWYVNGQNVASISLQAPKKPAGLIMNMWSNGGSWTGNMTVGDSAYLQLQWIDMVYNTSGPVAGSTVKREGLENYSPLESRAQGCKVVCNVNTETNPGTPVVASIALRCHIPTLLYVLASLVILI